MIRKINLIGCSLYSVFLSIFLKKYYGKKIEINIYEKGKFFLGSYQPIKIGKYKINPGFHAFEDIRSKKLIFFLSKFLKLKKIKKKKYQLGLKILRSIFQKNICNIMEKT